MGVSDGRPRIGIYGGYRVEVLPKCVAGERSIHVD
jgi:hypothetical protein